MAGPLVALVLIATPGCSRSTRPGPTATERSQTRLTAGNSKLVDDPCAIAPTPVLVALGLGDASRQRSVDPLFNACTIESDTRVLSLRLGSMTPIQTPVLESERRHRIELSGASVAVMLPRSLAMHRPWGRTIIATTDEGFVQFEFGADQAILGVDRSMVQLAERGIEELSS